MTTKRDLISTGTGRPSVTRYRAGIIDKTLTEGTRVDYLGTGVDDARDMVRVANNPDPAWPGNPWCTLRASEVILLGSGNAWRTSYYSARPSRGRRNSSATLIADTKPATISLPWWATTFGSDSSVTAGLTVRTELDLKTGRDVPDPWNRTFEINHIMVPTTLAASPLGVVDQFIGKLNSNTFWIGNVGFVAGTLWFAAPRITHIRSPAGAVEYDVIYHFIARADKWYQQRLIAYGSSPYYAIAADAMAPSTNFVAASIPY
jgi:hypothetical protein